MKARISAATAAALGLIGLAEIAAQPTITQDPKDQSVSLGANVTFSVSANSDSPLSYQWRHEATAIDWGTNEC